MSATKNLNEYYFSRLADLIKAKLVLISLHTKPEGMSDVEYTTRTSILTMTRGLIDKEIALLEKKLNINLEKEGL